MWSQWKSCQQTNFASSWLLRFELELSSFLLQCKTLQRQFINIFSWNYWAFLHFARSFNWSQSRFERTCTGGFVSSIIHWSRSSTNRARNFDRSPDFATFFEQKQGLVEKLYFFKERVLSFSNPTFFSIYWLRLTILVITIKDCTFKWKP